MGADSVQFTLMIPLELADALAKRRGSGAAKMDFVREAIAEKLSRDYGEKISPVLTRGEQGRRTDLEREKKALDRKSAAVSRKKVYAFNADGSPKSEDKIQKERNAVREEAMKLLMKRYSLARAILKERAAKGDKAAARALLEHEYASDSYFEAKFEDAPISKLTKLREKLDSARDKIFDLSGIKIEIMGMPVVVSDTVPATKPRRKRGDKAAGK